MPIETEAQFTAVYRATYDDVRRFVRRRSCEESVDDIVGETFLTAWRRRGELPDNARPWLFGVARHTMLNTHRGLRRRTALAVQIAQHVPLVAYDAIAAADHRLDLVSAWRQLTPVDQEVLALHVWEGLNDQDAATVLGCSRSAYAMRLTRSRRRLAKLLAPVGSVSPAFATTN
jgi:RNA polymerase sigma-70 factor (ECF subfamily)